MKHGRDYRRSHLGPESWAKDYDAKLFSPGSFDALLWQREQQLLDRILQQHVPGRDSYLDFACGTGRVLAHVEPHFRQAVGLDISETMLAVAKQRVRTTALVEGDATRDPMVLGGQQFDFITAFRFFLNAQPSLREEAMGFIASALKNEQSRLLFNVHGNRYSTRMLVAAKAGLTREQFASMSVSECIELAARHGLEVVEWYGIGSYDKALLRLMPLSAWRWAERVAALPKHLSVYLYFVCRRGRR
ncbi:class I SAM-dependent DNA methyltransferase [Peristeroidobacter agariperforans]|uniref:class I SAM-dependent DNA methyltransferase n=1 Tax=Peristeroidobacter agariperforans TaxID=268404 RepID=UPI00101DD1B7|nr:class I SAM-dependent methyltransferase [Peristeroidobacter agariperforans]